MGPLPWRNIIARALAEPFKQSRLFLKCACLPILFHLAILGFDRLGLAPDVARQPRGPTSLAQDMLLILPALIFEWSWMSALWNGKSQGILRQMATPTFWRFILLFALVDIAINLAFSAPGYGGSALEEMFEGDSPLIALCFLVVCLILFVMLGRLMIRLTPWRASVIARQQIIGPAVPIALTSGHAWRILLIRFLVWIGPGIFTIAMAIPGYAEHLQVRGVPLILAIVAGFYWIGADSAACLGIYRHLIGAN
jgi:hypothetical protein